MPRHSLKGRNKIQALLNTGKRYRSYRLAVYFDRTKPESNENYNVAFLLSGSSGNAVQRNRIKRWLREDFRQLQNDNGIVGLFAIRLSNKKGIAGEITHEELKNELITIYHKIIADG